MKLFFPVKAVKNWVKQLPVPFSIWPLIASFNICSFFMIQRCQRAKWRVLPFLISKSFLPEGFNYRQILPPLALGWQQLHNSLLSCSITIRISKHTQVLPLLRFHLLCGSFARHAEVLTGSSAVAFLFLPSLAATNGLKWREQNICVVLSLYRRPFIYPTAFLVHSGVVLSWVILMCAEYLGTQNTAKPSNQTTSPTLKGTPSSKRLFLRPEMSTPAILSSTRPFYSGFPPHCDDLTPWKSHMPCKGFGCNHTHCDAHAYLPALHCSEHSFSFQKVTPIPVISEASCVGPQ